MKMNSRRGALAVLAVLSLAGSCALAYAQPLAPSTDADKESAGRLAAQGWLVLLDRGDWGVAWDNAGDVFHRNVPLPKWMDAIPKVRGTYGVLIERQAAQSAYKTTLPGFGSGDYVTVIFQSKFDRKPDVQETVTTMREPDGRWRVVGYSPR